MHRCTKSGDCGADSYQTCTIKSHTNGRSLINMVGVLMDRLVGMGLSYSPQQFISYSYEGKLVRWKQKQNTLKTGLGLTIN